MYDILVKMNLHNIMKEKFKNLSYGMKKKLYLTTILIGDADIILMDEPFNGLDFESVSQLKIIIKDINGMKNTTFIISSHLIQDLNDICNRVCVMEKGKLLKDIDINGNNKRTLIIKALDIKKVRNKLLQLYKYEIVELDNSTLRIIILDEEFDSTNIVEYLYMNNIIFQQIYYENKPDIISEIYRK